MSICKSGSWSVAEFETSVHWSGHGDWNWSYSRIAASIQCGRSRYLWKQVWKYTHNITIWMFALFCLISQKQWDLWKMFIEHKIFILFYHTNFVWNIYSVLNISTLHTRCSQKHLKCSLLFSDFNQIWHVLKNLMKLQI